MGNLKRQTKLKECNKDNKILKQLNKYEYTMRKSLHI